MYPCQTEKGKTLESESIAMFNAMIKKNKGKISPNEAVAQTGFAKDEVMNGLDRLIELYEARVNLNQETGALQFIFKYPFFQRGKKTFSEKLATAANFLYKIFKQVYKVSIGIVLIAYTVIFAIILLVMSRSNDNDSRSGGGIDMVAVMFRAIFEGMFWYRFARISRPVEYAYDPYGNRYRTYKKEKKGGSFIQSVFTFVFGPDQPKFDPLSDAKEVAAYIRLVAKGKLTAANIIELSGVDYATAESRLAEYAGKFKGDLEISNDGVLYGEFSGMLGNATADEQKYIQFYKDEVEPPVQLTGNSGGRNFAIIAMNGFNLLMSFVLLTSDGTFIYKEETYNVSNFIFLTYFPLTVSLLYFIIPLLRLPAFLVRKKNYDYRVLHKKIIGYICAAKKKDFDLQEFLHFLKIENQTVAEEVKKMLEKIVLELEGTIEISSEGKPIYIFERLYNELLNR
jgi:hypothetical protein